MHPCGPYVGFLTCSGTTGTSHHFFFFFGFFRAKPMAYESSQGRGEIRATSAGFCHSHSKIGSELSLQPVLQLMALPDPWPTEWGRGLDPCLHEYSQFVPSVPRWELPYHTFDHYLVISFWKQEVWDLQSCSFSNYLEYYQRVPWDSIRILHVFFYFLKKKSLGFWKALHWICRSFCIVLTF